MTETGTLTAADVEALLAVQPPPPPGLMLRVEETLESVRLHVWLFNQRYWKHLAAATGVLAIGGVATVLALLESQTLESGAAWALLVALLVAVGALGTVAWALRNARGTIDVKPDSLAITSGGRRREWALGDVTSVRLRSGGEPTITIGLGRPGQPPISIGPPLELHVLDTRRRSTKLFENFDPQDRQWLAPVLRVLAGLGEA